MDQSDVPDVYVNSVRTGANVYEFTFDFGLTQPTTDPRSPGPTRPVVRMRMSPQHATVFERVLRDTIEKYERQIGHITVPAKVFTDIGIEP